MKKKEESKEDAPMTAEVVGNDGANPVSQENPEERVERGEKKEKEEKEVPAEKAPAKEAVPPVFEVSDSEKEMLLFFRRLNAKDSDPLKEFLGYGLNGEDAATAGLRFRIVCFLKTLEGYKAGSGKPTEKIDAALRLLLEIHLGIASGNLGIEMVEKALKAIGYDEEVRKAELKGRNAAIEAKLRKEEMSDGVPHVAQTRASGASDRMQSIFDLAGKAK